MHRWLNPRRALWLGIILVLLGYASQWLTLLAAPEQERSELDAMMTAITLGNAVVIPLGIAFVAFSLPGRLVLGRVLDAAAVDDDGGADGDDGARIRAVFTPRRVLVLGVVLIVAGFLLETYLINWAQAVSAQNGLLRDFVFYVAPLLRTVVLPLGVLLLPCAWLLALLDERGVSKLSDARVD